MPNYTALKAYAAQSEFSGQTDDQISAAANTPVSVAVNTPIGAVMNILLTGGDWPKIVQQSKGTGTDIITLCAVNAVALYGQQGQASDPIQTSTAAVAAAFNGSLAALESVSLVSAASVASITALQTRLIAPAATMGFNSVTPSEIAAARLYG